MTTTYQSALQDAAAKAGIDPQAEGVTKESDDDKSTPREPVAKPAAAKAPASAKAEPYHPLVADMDLDDLDETVRAKVLDKIRKYDRAFQKESTAFATYKKFQRLYTDNTDFAKEVDGVVAKHTGERRSSEPAKTTPTEARTAAEKYLDRQLREAKTPEEREAIRDARQAILDEITEDRDTVKAITRELAELKTDLAGLRGERQSSREASLDKELTALEESFSASLLDKHREEIYTWARKYPTWSARDLLYKIAKSDDIEESRLTPKATNGAKPRGSLPRRPAASVTPSATDTLDERFKTGTGKAQRWNLGAAFRQLASTKGKT